MRVSLIHPILSEISHHLASRLAISVGMYKSFLTDLIFPVTIVLPNLQLPVAATDANIALSLPLLDSKP